MSLKALKLPISVISDLYSKGLVAGNSSVQHDNATDPIIADEKSETVEVIEKAEALKYLGANKKNILVLVNNPGIAFVEESDLVFLTNMLTACKLSLQDVAIVNIANATAFSYKKTVAELAGSIIMLFGPTPAELNLPLDFPHFQVQPFSGLTFLSTPTLAEIKNDQLLKSKLWVSLRRVFNL